MKEVWKQIDGFPCYKVSNLGNVSSTKRNRYKLLKQQDLGKGYMHVRLYKDKKYYTKAVHRLVAEAFIQNPYNKEEVNHIDYVRNNNKVENLEWVTRKENIRHSSKKYSNARKGVLQMCKTNTGEHHISNGKRGMYKVELLKIRKYFKTLDQAKTFRDNILKEKFTFENGRYYYETI